MPESKTKSEPKLNLSNAATTDAAVAAAGAPIDEPKPIRLPKEAKGGWWWGTGRRKRAVARVRIKPAATAGGEQQFTVVMTDKKRKSIEKYFAEDRDRADCYAPLKITSTLAKFDVFVRVDGGGYMGQAQAIRMGLSRALSGYDPQLELALREAGFLTRDAREVERKKYGQAGARRRFQFSKR